MAIKTLEDYSRQCAVLKRIVLALPATDGTSREYRTAAIEQLNLCLRLGATIKKAQTDHTEKLKEVDFHQEGSSRFSNVFDGLMGSLQAGVTKVRGLKLGENELNKLRVMLNNPLAKTHVLPPAEMSNRHLAEHLDLLFASLSKDGKFDNQPFEAQLIQEAIKRLAM